MSLAAPSFGAVVFEDNFDAKSDWNSNSSLNGTVCTPSPTCSNAPSGWSSYRIMPSTGSSGASQTHSVPVISIQKPIGGLPDHTTGTGKAVVVYQSSDLPDEPSVWKGDGQLGKVLSQEYPELYIRYWVRSQAGWQSVVGGAMKTFRVTNWPGASAAPNMFDQGNNHPTLYIDQSTYGSWAGSQSGYGAFFPAYRCSASPDDYFCANSGNYYQSNYGDDWLVSPNGYPTSNYADTKWHRYDIHVKVNTIGQKNGLFTIAYDGTTLLTHNDIVFLESGTGRRGFNTIFLGGNSHNNYASKGDQWYAMDDVVVSTTAIPDNYVIGGGTSGGTTSTGDTTAPTVSISAPATGASVSGTVSVSANATDNVGVSKVEFYVNGALKATDTGSPYLYSWDTSAATAGSYTLMAKAYDAAGNNKSASVSVNVVKDATAPTVSLTAPGSGATVSGTVNMTASASDNVGVNKVEFYKDGALLSATNVAPFSYSWSTASTTNGSHTLMAKAYDATGNVGQSSSVTVNVSNSSTSTSGGTTTGTTTVAGLVAAYSFDEGTGTTVTDKSGKGNNGTISNATWNSYGKFGKALSFNGSSSMVTIPDSASLHLSSGMTLQAWVKPTSIGSKWQDIIYKGNENYYLEATSTTSSLPMVGISTSTGYAGNYGKSVMPSSTWTHLAATYDGAYMKFYVNGVLITSKAKSGTINSSTYPLQIGGDSLYGEYFAGMIDEVRVYNIALTQTQIQADMAKGIGL